MKPLFGLTVLLIAAAAVGQTPPSASLPWPQYPPAQGSARANGVHAAVVRIIVAERDGTSLGSGALVAVSQYHGLVVTNWHVVRDAAGPITVAFPDGFRSAATLLRTDRDWDLAALGIWRPNVAPIPLAAAPPRLGEALSIAGYGDGSYRTIAGRCTQYVSPGRSQPYEMVELSAPARNGDSGGPIFNSRGELAGVLFGSARGETAGSYSGRVRWFLTPVMDSFYRLQPGGAAIAAQSGASPGREALAAAHASSPTNRLPLASIPATSSQGSIPVSPSGNPTSAQPTAAEADQQAPGEAGFWEQVKNVLAAVGAVAILFHALRLFVVAPPPQPKGEKDRD